MTAWQVLNTLDAADYSLITLKNLTSHPMLNLFRYLLVNS